ncbi:MAG: hypothetical protein COV67_01695 [Nitrospinae bacterium CG11_big_fil_rev_8_21_14_0_20_56_8]|nr:MAG: hypothetical protein COV67_01695 [Nitrospinae bacterium CG11_big_fil_rev_8_21_14_0_20_56_8]
MEHAPEYCGKCHADQIKKMAFSSMASARGIINATRYALGAQAPNEPPYSLNPGEGEQPLPPAGKDHFADRYLKTQCLRCHLQSEAPHRPGDYRASGCAACHMVYGNDGMSLTHDRAIQKKQKKEVHARVNRFERKFAANSLKNPRGYPLLHKFTLAVPSVQCEHCHNHNGVGNEFEGLMGKPERPETTPDAVRKTRPVLYGREHTFLLPDIHREKGMHCIDCHGGRDLKGHEGPDGKWVSGSEIQCSDCHGTHSKYPDEFLLIKSDPRSGDILKSIGRNPNLSRKIRFGDTILLTSRGVPLPNIKREKDEWTLYSKVTGSKHSVPILKNIEKPPAHRVVKHMEKMECATCHARWSAGEWGLHLLNPNRFDPQKWKQWTLADPTLQYLVSNFDTKFSQVKMLDWLTAKSRPKGIEGNWIDGAWIGLFSETGWSNLILGKNPQGKYSIMKPRYQYLLLKENANGFDPPQVPVTADGKPGLTLLPYTPHTIRKAVRSCESCHENPVAMGLGDPALKRVSNAAEWNEVLKTGNHPFQSLQPKQVVTGAGEAIQTAYPPPARFLTREEMDSLRKRDKTYRALRYLDLKELSFPRLLLRGEYPYDIRHQAKEQQIKSQLAPAEAGGGSGQDAADVPPHTSGSTTPVAPDSSLTRPVP